MDSGEDIKQEAITFIKKNKSLLISTFADLSVCPAADKPVTYFMAGSPGAGKTEVSKRFINGLEKRNKNFKAVRIDADEIKEIIPSYDKTNSDLVQNGASLGVQKLYDYCLDKKQNVLVDNTFSNFGISCNNIERSLKRGREVGIIYIYQDPLLAWDFTKSRGLVEGRYIPKDFFIESFFNAKNNVDKVKQIYGEKVNVFLVIKSYTNGIEKTHFNVDEIDNYIKIVYDHKLLEEKLC